MPHYAYDDHGHLGPYLAQYPGLFALYTDTQVITSPLPLSPGATGQPLRPRKWSSPGRRAIGAAHRAQPIVWVDPPAAAYLPVSPPSQISPPSRFSSLSSASTPSSLSTASSPPTKRVRRLPTYAERMRAAEVEHEQRYQRGSMRTGHTGSGQLPLRPPSVPLKKATFAERMRAKELLGRRERLGREHESEMRKYDGRQESLSAAKQPARQRASGESSHKRPATPLPSEPRLAPLQQPAPTAKKGNTSLRSSKKASSKRHRSPPPRTKIHPAGQAIPPLPPWPAQVPLVYTQSSPDHLVYGALQVRRRKAVRLSQAQAPYVPSFSREPILRESRQSYPFSFSRLDRLSEHLSDLSTASSKHLSPSHSHTHASKVLPRDIQTQFTDLYAYLPLSPLELVPERTAPDAHAQLSPQHSADAMAARWRVMQRASREPGTWERRQFLPSLIALLTGLEVARHLRACVDWRAATAKHQQPSNPRLHRKRGSDDLAGKWRRSAARSSTKSKSTDMAAAKHISTVLKRLDRLDTRLCWQIALVAEALWGTKAQWDLYGGQVTVRLRRLADSLEREGFWVRFRWESMRGLS